MKNNTVLDKVKEIVKKDILKAQVPFFGFSVDLAFPDIGSGYSYCYTFDGEEFTRFNDHTLENIEITEVAPTIINQEYIKRLSSNNEIKYVLENVMNKESLKELLNDVKQNIELLNQNVIEENGYIETIYITFKDNELDYILLHCSYEDIIIDKEND